MIMDIEKIKGIVKVTIEKIRQFLREVKTELKKVSWPQRKETVASTSIVLVIVIIIAIFLGLVDLGLSKIIRVILS
jgi:preprotein translocase subunit SecE